MATVRWCRKAVQLTRVVHCSSCFDGHRDTQEPSGQASRPRRCATDEVDSVEFGETAATAAMTSCGGIRQMSCLPEVARSISGVLHDPYTGRDITFNRDEGTDVLVQIDHVVALLDAWQTGSSAVGSGEADAARQ